MSYREIKKTKTTQNKSIMNDVVTLEPEIYSSSDYSNPSSTGGNRQLKKKKNTNNSTFMMSFQLSRHSSNNSFENTLLTSKTDNNINSCSLCVIDLNDSYTLSDISDFYLD